MKKTADANWLGDGLHGKGSLTTQSGALKQQPYSFKTRFENENGKAGTNPEELLAASHAGCFTMAVTFAISAAGFKVEELNTHGEVELVKEGEGFTISGITLHLKAKIPGIPKDKFDEFTKTAKAQCPLSKALAAVKITLNAELLS